MIFEHCTVQYVLYNTTSSVVCLWCACTELSHTLTWFDLMEPMYKKFDPYEKVSLNEKLSEASKWFLYAGTYSMMSLAIRSVKGY